MNKLLKQITGLSKQEFINKYKQRVIKSGSFIIKRYKGLEICGVRNTRDKKWFLDIIINQNVTSESCNYKCITIAKGRY